MHLIGEAVPVSALLAAVVISTCDNTDVLDGECRVTSCAREVRDVPMGESVGMIELAWRGDAAAELEITVGVSPGRLTTRLPELAGRSARMPPSLS